MSAPSSSDDSSARRRRRLAQELEEERVELIDPVATRGDLTDDHGGLSGEDAATLQDLLLDELLYARQPPVHERRTSSYGCVVFPHDLPEELPAGLELLAVGPADAASARELCDGARTFLVRWAKGRRTDLAAVAGDDELTLVRLAEESGAWIVQRRRDGAVRVFGRERVYVNQFDRWSSKPYARTRWVQLTHAIHADDVAFDVGRSLLDLCLHLLSPRGIGSTFLWYPDALSDRARSFPAPARRLAAALNVAEPLHAEPLASVLASVDGACVVGPDGEVAAVQAFVSPSEMAIEVIPQHQGARHTNAARFSFDDRGVVALVVSADGPVTVFSDGLDLLRLDRDGVYQPDAAWHFPELAGRVNIVSKDLECTLCGRTMVADIAVVDGRRDRVKLRCRVCRCDIGTEDGLHAELRVTKPWEPKGGTATWGLRSAAVVGYAAQDRT